MRDFTSPMIGIKNMIPLCEPVLQGNEWKYVKKCLDSSWVSSVGHFVTEFEKQIAEFIGVKHAIATVNGTAALHISLVALDLTPNDAVIVPALTFIAPANAVRYCGATPIFIDSDPNTLCIDIQKLTDFLKKETHMKNGFTIHAASGKRIKAVIPVHIFGHPCLMDDLLDMGHMYNLDIIEDATESLGSEYKNKKTGTFGKLNCISFNGNKIITAGGGGMVVTHDSNLASKVRHLTTQAKKDPIEYDHDAIGYNYRLSNIQAALGMAQLEQLKSFIEIKRTNASLYKSLFSQMDVEFIWEQPWAKSNFWFYTIRVPKNKKDSLIRYLLSHDIQVRPIWKLLPLLPMYKNCPASNIESALKTYETCINIPCSVNLTSNQIERIVEKVRLFFKKK